MTVGYSPIPSRNFIRELQDDDLRNGFVADHLRTRLALLIRTLREERGWSQAELGHRLGKPQSVVSRLEDPDYGRVTLKTLFEVAVAFELPLYIDMPNWDEWFRLMSDMSSRNLQRRSFDAERLIALANKPPLTAGAAAIDAQSERLASLLIITGHSVLPYEPHRTAGSNIEGLLGFNGTTDIANQAIALVDTSVAPIDKIKTIQHPRPSVALAYGLWQ